MEQTETSEAPPKEKKGARSKLVVSVVVAVLVLGAAAAGALAGPKLLAGDKGPQKKEAAAKKEPEEKPVHHTVPLEPVVVDSRAKDGTIHHVKVALTLELAEKTTPEELQKYTPRGREAAIIYLRGLGFEALSDPERFEEIRKELSAKVGAALGAGRAERIVVTDFVAE